MSAAGLEEMSLRVRTARTHEERLAVIREASEVLGDMTTTITSLQNHYEMARHGGHYAQDMLRYWRVVSINVSEELDRRAHYIRIGRA